MKHFFLSCFFLIVVVILTPHSSSSFYPDDVNPINQTKAFLLVQARVTFGDQDEETVPLETRFYLLNKSLVEILKNEGFKTEFADDQKRKFTDNDYLEAAAKALLSDDEESTTIAYLIIQAVKNHQISTIKTDRSGNGRFTAMQRGTYYLFGIGNTESEVFVWNLPVELKTGKNSIEVDQNNTEVVFDR